MVDVDGQEVEQASVGFAAEPAGRDRADVDRMVGDLHRLEVRAGVEGVLRLAEVRVPNLAGLDVGVDSRVRLVVDEVDLARVAGDHPREDGRVALLLRERYGLRPVLAAGGGVGVVAALPAAPSGPAGVLGPRVVEVAAAVDGHLGEDVPGAIRTAVGD